MKASPGGPVCQKFRKRYTATGKRKAFFLISHWSTVLCFLRRVCLLGGRLGITSVCRQPVIAPLTRKVLAHEADGEPPPCRYLVLTATCLVHRVPPPRRSSGSVWIAVYAVGVVSSDALLHIGLCGTSTRGRTLFRGWGSHVRPRHK